MVNIELVLDQLEIRSLIEQYSDAVNRRDSEAVGRLWADNGRWSVPEAEGFADISGRDAIKAAWEQLLDVFPVAFFLCVPANIVIDADVATTRSYGQELVKDKAGALSTAVGFYEDRFIRTHSGWLFGERVWHTICRYSPQQR